MSDFFNFNCDLEERTIVFAAIVIDIAKKLDIKELESSLKWRLEN
jgi:hypothetical protein